MKRRGFTLIELLVFLAIFSLVVIAFISIFVEVVSTQSQQSSVYEVESQGQFLLQQIEYYVQNARLIDGTLDTPGILTLRESVASSSIDPISITLASGTVYLQEGTGGTPQALTSDKVTVSGLQFTRHYNLNSSSSAYGTDSVSYSFTMSSANVPVGDPQYYSQSFQSAAAVLAPVPKIALIQQASGAQSGAGITSVTSTFATDNATSSLLVAVVSHTGTTGDTITLSDSAGNTWNLATSTTYAAYNQKLAVYYAMNVKNSSNTVTASFSSGVASPSLFVYEYRGAATSSSFDASASQVQSSTTVPTSGTGSPTSTVELILGALYANPSTGTVAPGTGFTLETSSTVSATYVEDENLYVTGPVSTPWTYTATSPPTTSSSAVMVTFQ